MRLLDWSSITTYEPHADGRNLLLAEWKSGSCELDPASTATTTNIRTTTALLTTTSIRDLIATELVSLEPHQVSEVYLLCAQEAARLLQQHKHKLGMSVGTCQEVLWIAHGYYFFRREGAVMTSAVNLITGELTEGFENTLKKYPLTASPQSPIVQPEISLGDGLGVALRGISASADAEAGILDMLIIEEAHHSLIFSEGLGIKKKEHSALTQGAGSLDLGGPHLISAALVYTPILTYPLPATRKTLIYDPLVGRLYQSKE